MNRILDLSLYSYTRLTPDHEDLGFLSMYGEHSDLRTERGADSMDVFEPAAMFSALPIMFAPSNLTGGNIPSVTGLPADISIIQASIGNIDLSAAVFADMDSDILTVTLTASGGEFSALGDGAGNSVVETLVSETQITLVGLADNINAYLDIVTNIQYLAAESSLGDNGETITVTLDDVDHMAVMGGVINIDIVEPPSLVVTTASDIVDAFDGQTSLREAIALANGNADQSDITFSGDLAGQTIILTSGELVLSTDISIDGDIVGDDNRADISISGNELARIFSVVGSGTDVDLASLTLIDGDTGSNMPSINPAQNNEGFANLVGGNGTGGAIRIAANSSATITHSTISGNSAFYGGGGIANYGTVTLLNTTLHDNSSDDEGGAILNAGVANLTNVTVSSNGSGSEGIGSGGGLAATSGSTTTIIHSTFSGNYAGAEGGGIYQASGASLSLQNSIVLGNSAFTSHTELSAGFTNNGGNIISGDSAAVFDQLGMSNGGLLGDNGGAVSAILLSSSTLNPALDIGSAVPGITTDAIGNARASDLTLVDNGGIADAGAVELPNFAETPGLVVTISADVVDAFDGETSLREAIAFANSNSDESTISFETDLAGQVVLLTNGELALTTDIIIEGDIVGTDGRSDISVSGNGNSRVFNASGAGTEVTFNSVSIINGASGAGENGGGLFVGNGATVTLFQSTLSDNMAGDGVDGANGLDQNDSLDGGVGVDGADGADGGGAFVGNGGTLILINSTVSDNNAGGGGNGGAGGSAVDGNGGAGGNGGEAGDGGGIHVASGGMLTVTNSTITGNSAGIAGPGGSGGYTINGTGGAGGNASSDGSGGGINVADGATIVATNATISLNIGTSSFAGSASGGGSQNGMAGAPGLSNTSGFGSQINIEEMGIATLTNTIAINSFAPFGFSSVQGTYMDGGSNFTNGQVFEGGMFTGSTLTGAQVFGANILADNGGPVETIALLNDPANPVLDVAVAPMGLPSVDANGQIRIVDLAVIDNGGPIDAGAFEVQVNTQEIPSLVVTIAGDVVDEFDGETSLREAVNFANSNADQSAITFAGGVSNITLTMGELSLTSSLSITGNGLTISGNDSGRVFNISGSGTVVSLNTVAVTQGYAADFGGAIYVGANAGLGVQSSTISASEAGQGGAIFNNGGTVAITGSTLTGNNSTYSGTDDGGGAIFNNGSGAITVNSTTVSGNDSGAAGGGIFSNGGTVNVNASTLSGNMAATGGGGITNLGGTLNLTNTTLANNSAVASGGGVLTSGGGLVNAINATLSGNIAGASGGGIANLGSTVTLTNTIALGNDAAADTEISGIYTNNGGNITSGDSAAIFDSVNGTAGVLGSNGGPVQTIALLSDAMNVALDVGVAGAGVTTDARGLERDVDLDETTILGGVDVDNGGTVDAGAFELQAVMVPVGPPTGDPEPDSLIVTTNLDVVDQFDNLTSLREAINFANSQAGADTVTFDGAIFSGGANSLIRLTDGEIVISDELTIDGGTATDLVISGDANGDDILQFGTFITDIVLGGDTASLLEDNSRIFSASATTTLDSVTLTGGVTDTNNSGGGAVNASGTLTIIDSIVSGNLTTGTASSGGGVSAATLTLTGSTVSGNFTTGSSAHGGGVAAGNATISNSTLSGNSTSGTNSNGGGLGGTAGGNGTLTAVLTNTTLSGNSAVLFGGGVFGTDLTIVNTTVSGNVAGTSAGGVGNLGPSIVTNSIILGNTTASLTSNEVFTAPTTLTGLNIIGASMTDFDASASANAINADPATVFANTVANGGVTAGLLANNGGSVQTIALRPDALNPALDVGIAPAGFPTDANGSMRDIDIAMLDNGGTVDSGAFELSGLDAMINGAPTVTNLPTDVTVNENTPGNIDLSAAVFADPNDDPLVVTLTVNQGAFTSATDGAGVGAGVTASLDAANQITLSGTAVDINSYLDTPANIQYAPATDVFGNDVANITVVASDAIATVNLGTVNIDVTQINNAPIITAPAGTLNATEQIAINLASAGFSFVDSDAENFPLRLTLEVGEGILDVSAGDVPGLTITPVGPGTVTIEGTSTNLNALLSGTGAANPGFINYTADSDAPSATTQLTITVNDLGSVGEDPGLSGDAASEEDVEVITIAIAAVDDPLVAADDMFDLDEDSTLSGSLFSDNGNGTDNDPDLQLFDVTAINGIAANVNTQITLLSGAVLTVNDDGTFAYNPGSAFDFLDDGETAVDSFTYTITNDGRLSETATATFSIIGNSDGNQVLTGTPGPDPLDGGSDNDTISGLGGDDTLLGGSGDDSINGDEGADIIEGGSGQDTLNGGADNDNISGNEGADLIRGDAGDDSLDGGRQNDRLYGGDGEDQLDGGFGRDFLSGGNDDDLLLGGNRNDTLLGDNGEDRLFGGFGDDQLFGGNQNDQLLGGEGNDLLNGEFDRDFLNGGNGDDTLLGGNGEDSLFGEAGDDQLFGGNQNDQLLGGEGNDLLNGEFGRDFLNGGNGDDTILGGNRNDTLLGGNDDDILLGGSGDDELRAGTGQDLLAGGSGNDTLEGRGGFDILFGDAGDDELSGGANADTFVFQDGFGNDVITDFEVASTAERIDLSRVTNISDFADVLANLNADMDGNAVISDGVNSITLQGVAMGDLTMDDFIF